MGAAADYLREQYTKKQNKIASSGRVAGLTGTSNYSRSSSSSNTATNPLDYATYRYETWRANDEVALNNISRNSSSSSTTSSSGTTSSSNTISSVDTTSDNDATEVAGTSTEISEAADYPSSNTVVSSDVNDVSSNTATDFNGGEEITNDYSSESEIVAEPTIETPAEEQTVAVVEEVPATSEDQTVAVAEEVPATPEQPSGQYIYAPNEGGELWGSPYNDTLVGGDGNDIFIGGKDQGPDTFLNVSSSDEVHLTDVTLNDLADVKKEGDTITFTFKTGNTVNIQSSEAVSGAIVLADSTWHFQHTT